jgi:hypothetical protein
VKVLVWQLLILCLDKLQVFHAYFSGGAGYKQFGHF